MSNLWAKVIKKIHICKQKPTYVHFFDYSLCEFSEFIIIKAVPILG